MTWLSAAPWLIALAGVIGGGAFGGIERMNYLEEKSARASALYNAQQATLKAQVEDAIRTKAIEDAHASEVAKLKEQANARDIAIALAVPTNACTGSPAMRALFNGLRARGLTPSPDQPRSADRAGKAVP